MTKGAAVDKEVVAELKELRQVKKAYERMKIEHDLLKKRSYSPPVQDRHLCLRPPASAAVGEAVVESSTRYRMKTIALAAYLLAFGASTHAEHAASSRQLVIPLASPSTIERVVSRSLLLRVFGTPEGLEVELTSKEPIRGCFHNLLHRAPHGPDPSEILPWQVAAGSFPNVRSIPVCGRALTVEILLLAPMLSSDPTRFTAGDLAVSIKPRKKALHAGTW